ncbi:MAG: MBL fold metallo-hydrolase, partial [Acidimicrobiia bacterium]
MNFTLDVLGSCGSGPSRTAPASGYLVRSDTTAIWVDAGTGTFHQLARRIDPADVAATVISHLHADHCSDLFGWFHYLAYRLQLDHAIPVLLPPGGTERIETFLG